MGVVPEAEFIGARKAAWLRCFRICRRLIDRILHFRDEQRAVTQIEVRAAAVLLLRIAGIASCRVAVEHARQHGHRVRCFCPETNAKRGQWVSGAARGHVGGRQDRPAERGIHERRGVLADHEFLIKTLLAKLYIESSVEQRLLVPELPQASACLCLDPACGLQREQGALGQVATMNLQAGDVERAARQAEGFGRVDLKVGLGKAVVSTFTRDAA